MDAQAEIEVRKPSAPVNVGKLQAGVDAFVEGLEAEFAEDVIARCLLSKGADILLKTDGPFASRWAISRTMDLMTGFWVDENIKSFIESYQK